MNFTVSHNFHLQYLPANLHTSWNSCTSNGKVGKMARWQQKQIRDILLCLHQPNPQLGHHPALERFGILIFFQLPGKLWGYLMMLLFDLGMI